MEYLTTLTGELLRKFRKRFTAWRRGGNYKSSATKRARMNRTIVVRGDDGFMVRVWHGPSFLLPPEYVHARPFTPPSFLFFLFIYRTIRLSGFDP